MSTSEPSDFDAYDIAKAEIDAWRGRCMNIFARGEKAVTESIAILAQVTPTIRLEPLAGQRLNSLEKQVGKQQVTKAQEKLLNAIAEWRIHDERRPAFSHGVVTEMLDRRGIWHARMDFLAIQKGACVPVRTAFSKSEADEFEKSLHQAFSKLSGQLGHLRKRLDA